MENLTLSTPSFTEFKFKDIGRPPALLHRFTSAHLGGIDPSPSPSPPPEQHSGASSPSVSRSRPTLMQVLGTGPNDADVAGAAASTSSDTIAGPTLQPSSGKVSSSVPSVTTLPLDNALSNSSEWQLRYPSFEPPKFDPHSHPSSMPLPDSVTKVTPPTSTELLLQGEHSLETLIKLKDQLLSSLASYTPSNPSAAFLLAKESHEQSSSALDAAQRAHILAQQSLNSVQECANVAQEALRAAERAHSLAEDTTAAIEKIKTDNEPWTALQEAVRIELASLTQWIEAEEKSRLLAEMRRLANSARDLRTSTDGWGDNPQPDRVTQRSRDSINDFGPMPDSDIVMGSPDDLRQDVDLPHRQVDNTPVPDDDVRRRQDIQRRLDEAIVAAEAKRLEDEARDMALRKDEEERLKRVMDAELAARRAREEEEAEIQQARQQREKEKKQQAEEAGAQRALQEKERREAEEALANRSREVERRRALELKRHQDLLDDQKKQREEVQRAKAQYNRLQAARIQAERAKDSSTENASISPAPPASIKSAIPQSNGLPHLSALESVSTDAATSVPTVPSSYSQVSSSMPLSSLSACPPTSPLGPVSTLIGSVGVQAHGEAAMPVQVPQQVYQKGTSRVLSGDVKLGPTSTHKTDPSASLIRTASLGLRSRVSETSLMPSTLPPADTAPRQADSKVLSTSLSNITSPRTGNFESQKHLSTDKHSLPPIDHFPQSHLSTPEFEPMVPYSSSDNGNVPIIKMEETDELLHVQEANLRHIRERSRVDVSQMTKTEEADCRSLNTVPQSLKGIPSTSPVPSHVRNALPSRNMPASTLLPAAGSVRTSNIPAPQKNAVQILVKPSQSTIATVTSSPALPKKAKASKVPPANQKTSQPSQGNQNASPNKQPQPQTDTKAPAPSVNQKAVPTKQQVQVCIEAVSRSVPNAPPGPKPPVQKKIPTKPRSASPPTGQVDHGRAAYSQSSYQSGSLTSRVTEPRGPSPMGPEGFPSESGWYNTRSVDEDISHGRRSYDSDGHLSSSNRRSRYSTPQDYPSAPSSHSYDRRCDHYSPSPSPVSRGRPMSPIARSPSPTLGMKRRREEPAFIRTRRQRQEDNDSYSHKSISAARDIPPRPQTPPATWNRKISPPPTLVSRLDMDYARRNPAVDSDYSAAPAHPSTRSYKASHQPDTTPPRVGGSKNHLLERLSNVSGKPPPSQPLRGGRGRGRGRGGGNSKPRLAARIGDAGINDSY
ncbi:hypothetical protein EDD18DRAFT_323607 [Armillaria luteobubalina]|uniref:Uncharacterized protein n=1 Tax=Armillaria luteobubalina TaxID=153913 RepID=A0AA39QMI8_9AGAR|nr:hypothetical protein EDD18DRAFT_323607 [Armillaria luteobubalina]